MTPWPPPAWLDAAENPPYAGGPWFSLPRAMRAITFIQRYCSHNKGQWAGHKFRLLPWQWLLLTRLFGWLKEDGTRKYRVCYVEIPKKNGKSELAAAIALYLFLADQEPGAEVYSAAADRDQAGLVFGEAEKMVNADPRLKRRCKIIGSTKRMVRHKTGSFYRVLSSDVKTKHGLNPHGVIFDELHAQPNRHLWDVLVEGTDIARRQQVILVLTTAGIHDKESIAWQVHEKARKVRAGLISDPTFLPIIYAAEPPQAEEAGQEQLQASEWWEYPAAWRRANPSLGYIFAEDNLRQHYQEVREDPARINNFLRYRLNVWVSQATRAIPMPAWDECAALKVSEENLRGRRCWGGLDLSSTTDLASSAMVWEPDEDGVVPVKVWFWMPEADIKARVRRDNASYDLWARQKYLTLTPGNVIDYGFILAQINQEASHYPHLEEIGYDPWNATQVALQLKDEDGLVMVEHRQGYKSMSPPTKELLRLIIARKLAHGGHPVLRWCADNLATTSDPAENIKPAKDKSTGRIDGVVAIINALGRMLVNMSDQTSVYEKRGLLVL